MSCTCFGYTAKIQISHFVSLDIVKIKDMDTFEQTIPANINAIRQETIPVVFQEKEIGRCTLRAEGYTLIGTYRLEQDIDFEKYELNYAFIGGGLVKVIIKGVQNEQ